MQVLLNVYLAAILAGGPAPSAGYPAHGPGMPTLVTVRLSEWKVEMSPARVPGGLVRFSVVNTGSIPHGFEVEGSGLEREIALIQPGSSDSLTVTLKPGAYEVYCPIGGDSHKRLGMEAHLRVGGAAERSTGAASHEAMAGTGKVAGIMVTGAGPVIQILPGPFPFPDSAGPILRSFGNEQEGLEAQIKDGPYSNNVARINGRFSLTAWDLGSVRDSVDGQAEFTTEDSTRWRLVLDRVQTKDVPHHPKFGGVIMGLYYHGITQVHTPLVPTINSKVAVWAIGHLFRNDTLVTDNAMVHVMLLSRTRRDGDFAISCWDCSRNPIEELQLQILPGPGEPKFVAPGGFLFVNWERSTASAPAS
ncbi:MAG TPA: hypothetical protein VEI47_04635 [Gemmatimonadales bacterium]|nr:hypothetical protein [Gemmatimonadales bacterium]